MASRLDLHAILKDITTNVYFQPPASIQMSYPCIIYKRDDADEKYAGNSLYHKKIRYMITVVDRDPDSSIPDEVAQLPLCKYDRFYAVDNLNHDVFNLYF